MSSLEYAQARMQGRLGARPDAASWRELDAIDNLGAYLDALQRTPLRSWVAGLDARADLHEIDLRLRERFRAHVGEVARWSPPQWRPAVLWLSRLLDLPAMVHLVSGGAALPWMAREPELRRLAERSGSGRAAAIPDFLRPDPRRAGTRAAAPDPGGARAAWLAGWQRRWPATDAETSQGLLAIAAKVLRHLQQFRRATPREAWHVRAGLERELRAVFRRSALRPEAAFAYLGLAALGLERLRAQLVRRALLRREPTLA